MYHVEIAVKIQNDFDSYIFKHIKSEASQDGLIGFFSPTYYLDIEWTMRDLTAQVTSSLLPFPRVTLDALGEDEITLDSVLHGRFTVGKIIVL